MKKIKQSIFMVAALLLSLSSCDSDDIPIIDTSDYKTLSLRISSDVATRGISESVPDGTPVVFNTGTLFLVNSDGIIVQHFNIVPRGQATVGSNISRADFDSQVTIDNVPGQVVEAVVVANTAGNNTAGSINAVGERILDIVTQHDVTNVNLFGRANFQPTGFVHPISGNNVHETNILLRPTVARFEISDITGVGQIESFTIEGIFIDKFYRQAQVAGSILTTADNFISNGQDADLFVYGSTAYPSALTPAIFDWGTWQGSRSTSLTITPDNAGNVWAYQLFAQVDANEDATTVPHIVIRMNNVTLRDGTVIQGARFLTIRGILAQNSALQGIRAGTVYRFPAGEIVFSERDLSPRPNENVLDARVAISLANWNEETMRLPFRQHNPQSAVMCFNTTMMVVRPTNVNVAGSVTGRATVVYFDVGEALGGSGNYSYQWQESADGIVWIDSNDETSQNANFQLQRVLTRGNVYFFRRIVTDTVSGEILTSNAATVSEPAPTLAMPDYVTMNGVTFSTRNLYTPGVFMDKPFMRGLFYRPGCAIPYQVRGEVVRTTNPNQEGYFVPLYARGFYNGVWEQWWQNDRYAWSSNLNTTIPIWDSSRNPCPAGWRLPNQRSGEIELFLAGFTSSNNLGNFPQSVSAGVGCNPGTLWEDDTGVQFFMESRLSFGWTQNQRFDGSISNANISGFLTMSQGGTGLARMVRCVKDILTPLREPVLCRDEHTNIGASGNFFTIGGVAGAGFRVYGELGEFTYEWQYSLDGITWRTVTWSTGQGRAANGGLNINMSPGGGSVSPGTGHINFTTDRYFRRITTSLPSGNTLTSNAIWIRAADVRR